MRVDLPTEWSAQGQRCWKRLSWWAPTPPRVVVEALKLAQLSPDDLVYDLGCGDGRVIARAAKMFGARAIGFDIDQGRIREARERIAWLGVSHLASVRRQDMLAIRTLHKATVVYAYLPQHALNRLKPLLLKRCRRGTKVISVATWLYGWRTEKEFAIRINGTKWYIGLWVV